jgi:hypothetical protein
VLGTPTSKVPVVLAWSYGLTLVLSSTYKKQPAPSDILSYGAGMHEQTDIVILVLTLLIAIARNHKRKHKKRVAPHRR